MAFEAQDRIAETVARDMQALHNALLERYLKAPPRDLAEAATLYDEVTRFMVNGGLEGAMVDEVIIDAIDAGGVSAIGVDVSAEPVLSVVVEGIAADISKQFDEAARSFRRAALAMVVNGVGYDDAITQLQTDLKTTRERAKSAAFTGASALSRAAVIAFGESDTEPVVYLYGGPRDSITREFCRHRVGKAYTREALDAFDDHPDRKGQPDPTSVYLGGYNCRHTLSPLTESEARERGLEIVGLGNGDSEARQA